jgi:hypothetical protein
MADLNCHYGGFVALDSLGVTLSINSHTEMQDFCINSRIL